MSFFSTHSKIHSSKERAHKLVKNGCILCRYGKKVVRSYLFGCCTFPKKVNGKPEKIAAATTRKNFNEKEQSFQKAKPQPINRPLKQKEERVQLGDEQLMLIISEFLWLFS